MLRFLISVGITVVIVLIAATALSGYISGSHTTVSAATHIIFDGSCTTNASGRCTIEMNNLSPLSYPAGITNSTNIFLISDLQSYVSLFVFPINASVTFIDTNGVYHSIALNKTDDYSASAYINYTISYAILHMVWSVNGTAVNSARMNLTLMRTLPCSGTSC